MSGHTPGPWHFGNIGTGWSVGCEQNDCAVLIAWLQLGGALSGREVRANAALIAAAPELLAALEAATERLAEVSNYLGPFDHGLMFGALTDAVRDGRAAIAKAKGGVP